MRKILFYIVIIFTIGNYRLQAAVSGSVPILNKESFGARQIALGDTFTGIADDINTLSVNPGGIGFFTKKRVSLMYMRYTEDFTFGYAAAGIPIKKGDSSIGIEFGYFSMTEFDFYNSVGENNGNSIEAGDILLGVSYGDKILRYFNINKDLSAGVTVKYIKSELAGDKISILAGDFGIVYKASIFGFGRKKANNFSTGISIQNIKIMNDSSIDIPVKYRAGLGYNIYTDKNNSILLGTDIILRDSGNTETSIGIEYGLMKIISVRAGYKVTGIDTGKVTAGIGVSYNISGYNLHLDYGNVLLSDLGNIHILSIGIIF